VSVGDATEDEHKQMAVHPWAVARETTLSFSRRPSMKARKNIDQNGRKDEFSVVGLVVGSKRR
jgi:hypothetical protein